MSNEISIQTPLADKDIEKLTIGDKVLLSGTIYTARDAAHKKLVDLINNDQPLPFHLQGAVIYFVGPAPAKPGAVIGSAGPTTSYRMDPYSQVLLDHGLKGMIGKGGRSQPVIDSIVKNKAVYFAAVGGAAVVMAECIKSVEIIAYPELGTEAVRKMEVENLPVFVAIDSDGNDIYK
ncbi:MAG: Fe-S-containing hydro-lyase [Fidelibacterota bacterium]